MATRLTEIILIFASRNYNYMIYMKASLILSFLLVCFNIALAKGVDEEAHLEQVVSIYYDGTNESEFYKAVDNYRNFLKGKNNEQKYYQLWEKDINYDIQHNHFRNALQKMEQLKNELKEAKAEDFYYMVDYLMGVFYGMREDNVLAKQHLQQAAELVDPNKAHDALLRIYQTLANICIFKNLEKGLEGYVWADKAIDMAKDPEDLCGSLALKAMVAFGHNDKSTFYKCVGEIEKIKKEHPNWEFKMYQKYVEMGRATYDGNFDKAIVTCDSIRDEVGRLYFLATIYEIKGDLQKERDTLFELLRAKDQRNNEISTLTVNDINLDFLIEQERLNVHKIQMYACVAIVAIIAITFLLFFIIRARLRRKK